MAIGRTNAGGGAKISGTIEQIKVGTGATVNKGDFVSLEMEGSVLNLTDALLPTVANYGQSNGVVAKWGNTLFVANTGHNSTSSPTKNIYRIGAFTVNADGTLTQIATYVSDERSTGEPKSYDIVALSATRVMVAYYAQYGGIVMQYCYVLELSGSTFTVIASYAQSGPTGLAANNYIRPSLFALSPNSFIYTNMNSNSNQFRFRVISFSGSTISMGAEVGEAASYQQNGYFIKTGTNTCIFRYDGKYLPLTVTGTTLTKGAVVALTDIIGYPNDCISLGDGKYLGYSSMSRYQQAIPGFEFMTDDVANLTFAKPVTLALNGSSGPPYGTVTKIGRNRYMMFAHNSTTHTQFAPLYLRRNMFSEYTLKNVSDTSGTFRSIDLTKAYCLDNGLVAIAASNRVAIIETDEWVIPCADYRNMFGVALESGSDGDVIKVAVPD